ncbi:MFS transporter [Enterobacter roggenkampii]|uniref:MFS transporter n=1 Tax=Enterobacter roggenkampii TaxID=1812935 RepID=UPI00201A0394|nr:MFS transporter [Enterobacter roggenkampii]UQQ49959.1 MFS transporter [Enterobacter roggenkampii]
METPALPHRLALTAGCNQLINWGILFYMPGTFALAISADRGWSSPQIYLGLTLAMLVMAVVSPFVARLLARFGGQKVVMGGTLLHVMRWQDALRIYALLGLLSALLIRTLPRQRLTVTTEIAAPPLNNERRNGWLYAAFIALITFVSNGTSTHLPEFIAHYGLPVAIGMLWGIGQTGARSLEVLAGARLTPFTLTLFTALAMPLCFLVGLSSALFVWCAAGFVLGYGAINGLVTLVKATLPLELFSAESYARRTGMLLIPGQLMAAASPYAYAWLNKMLGIAGAMGVSTGLTLLIAGLAIAIVRRPGRQTVSHCIPRATVTNGYKTPPPANISDT